MFSSVFYLFLCFFVFFFPCVCFVLFCFGLVFFHFVCFLGFFLPHGLRKFKLWFELGVQTNQKETATSSHSGIPTINLRTFHLEMDCGFANSFTESHFTACHVLSHHSRAQNLKLII